jgi:hypothetical protein
MLNDLAALTPPALVCVAFLIGLVALLRREMAPKRRGREDTERRVREAADRERDNSGNNGIIAAKAPRQVTAADDLGDVSRSPGGRGTPG